MPSQSPPSTKEMHEEFQYFKDIKSPFVCSSEVKLIIVANVSDAFQRLELRKGTYGQPYATKTFLGWSMFENKIINSQGNKGTAHHNNKITASKNDAVIEC